MIRPLLSALLLASVAAPALAGAQATVQAVPGSTDADQLAAEMRLLASNPTDISALIGAGELSLKLDDLGAAASFFARAEKVDPRNGRVKAGQAAILVHAERPGEALRYFATAESYGLPATAFASERGLAYDLIGEQERAQRDYRLALRTAADDETLRRYALSLGISGKRDLAEQQLRPLLAKQDRGAWRARAFVEAMTGNVGEANHIATTMMPPGTAAGLQPFFDRLAMLGTIDRAFAVHFGEVRGTAQRVADARLAPAMAALGADPYAPRPVALAATATATAPVKDKHRGRKEKAPVQVVVATPAPEPLPQAPRYAGTQVAATPMRGVAPTAWPQAAPVAMPSRGPTPPTRGSTATPSVTLAAATAGMAALPARMAATPPAERDVRVATTPVPGTAMGVPAAVTPAAVRAASPYVATVAVAPPVPAPPAPFIAAQPRPVIVADQPARVTALPSGPTTVTAAPQHPSAASPPANFIEPTPSVTVAKAQPLPAPVSARPEHRDQLASIVGGLPIPAAELGIEAQHRSEPVPAPVPTPDAAQQAAERAAAERAAAQRVAAERAAAVKALADKKAAERKAAADKKALAEKKAAAEKKAEEAREAAEQRKIERANPERIWVQVAGGAYEGDLPKAWAAAKAKGGDAFAGHASGWTTPLRFTNRVLAGPFKTDEEARAFVNKLKAKGMSTFTFTSDAGQVVKKLGSE